MLIFNYYINLIIGVYINLEFRYIIIKYPYHQDLKSIWSIQS